MNIDQNYSADYKLGDFTGLAKDYSLHRPDYSPSVLEALLALIAKPISEIDFVDVGAPLCQDRSPVS